MANPYRKIRGAIRRAHYVRMVWLTSDCEYVVPLTKGAALGLVAQMEEADDLPTVWVNSDHVLTLDRGSGDAEDLPERKANPISYID